MSQGQDELLPVGPNHRDEALTFRGVLGSMARGGLINNGASSYAFLLMYGFFHPTIMYADVISLAQKH